MKSIYFCCLVILISLKTTVVMAQVHPMSPKNENSMWNHKIGSLTNEAIYKAKQNSSKLNSTTSTYWNGVEMELRAKTEYTYENDHLVSVEYFLMEDSVWYEDAKWEYVYENELLVSDTYLSFEFGSDEYIPIEQYKYGYQIIDNEPRLISDLYREWEEGSGWVSVEKTDYIYENGLISGGSEFYWNSSEWIEIERFTTTSVNDTTYITYFAFDSEIWIEYSREIYPNISLSELYNFYSEIITEIDLGLTYLSLEFPDYIYQEKIDESWENIDGQLTVNYFDMHDGKLKMREIQHGYWDEEWTVSYNNEIWYNQKVNPDSATTYVFYETEREAVGQEIYIYNNASQLAEVGYLQNTGNGLTLYSTTVLNWEVGTSNESESGITSFKLNPAYPNPFNPSTNITYSMSRAGEIKISVYDILGRHVATLINGIQPAGDHRVQFNAGSLSSGLYIVRMEVGEYQKSHMITLIK